MQAVSDEQLIQWVAAGDASCLATLFERHHLTLFNYCLRICRDQSLSEDVVQDTFMRMLKAAARYRGDGSFRSWMFHIARNHLYDRLRSQGRHQAMDDSTEPAADDDPGPAEQLDQNQQQLRLSQALDCLPPAAREVIWLGRFQFNSYEELAAVLGCSAGAARVRMHRAMQQLKDAFMKLDSEAQHA